MLAYTFHIIYLQYQYLFLMFDYPFTFEKYDLTQTLSNPLRFKHNCDKIDIHLAYTCTPFQN